jgi:hypothetical protein
METVQLPEYGLTVSNHNSVIGPNGTGKSLLLKQMVSALTDNHADNSGEWLFQIDLSQYYDNPRDYLESTDHGWLHTLLSTFTSKVEITPDSFSGYLSVDDYYSDQYSQYTIENFSDLIANITDREFPESEFYSYRGIYRIDKFILSIIRLTRSSLSEKTFLRESLKKPFFGRSSGHVLSDQWVLYGSVPMKRARQLFERSFLYSQIEFYLGSKELGAVRLTISDDVCRKFPEIFYWHEEKTENIFAGPYPIILGEDFLFPLLYKGLRFWYQEEPR